jgi:ABC-type transporter Mla subunit MlaD
LRPALSAAQGVLDELDTQDGSLARLIPVAQQATQQLDSRRSDVGPLIDQLAATLNATAGAATPLGRGIAGLPATLSRLRTTAGSLQSTAGAATPLVQALQPVTGPLATAVTGLPALLTRVHAAAPTFDKALDQARSTLSAGAPALSRLSKAFPVLRSQAPGISTLMSELDQAAPGIAEGFFVDFPDQADESGKQPFDPFAEPTRAYWRGAAVFSCEAFGVPVAPGCLTKAIANLSAVPFPAYVQREASASRLLDYLLGK